MTLLDDIGGDDSLVALVNRFYDLVETLPEGATLRRLHGRGHGIAHARIEQVDFMSGFLGGRQHYRERHGHMDVKLIHAHVPIRALDAENWLACMDVALREEGLAGPHIEKLRAVLRRDALILVNDVPDWEETGTRGIKL